MINLWRKKNIGNSMNTSFAKHWQMFKVWWFIFKNRIACFFSFFFLSSFEHKQTNIEYQTIRFSWCNMCGNRTKAFFSWMKYKKKEQQLIVEQLSTNLCVYWIGWRYEKCESNTLAHSFPITGNNASMIVSPRIQ